MRALLIAPLLALVLHVAPAQASDPGGPPITVTITASTIPAWAASKDWQPCAFDENVGPRCVWDARHNGDGRGVSYIRTHSGATIYVTHRVAHWLLLPAYAARRA